MAQRPPKYCCKMAQKSLKKPRRISWQKAPIEDGLRVFCALAVLFRIKQFHHAYLSPGGAVCLL